MLLKCVKAFCLPFGETVVAARQFSTGLQRRLVYLQLKTHKQGSVFLEAVGNKKHLENFLSQVLA